jgi:BioD-like phosphotransacetylase family protein
LGVLCIVAAEKAAGKTAVCAGIARNLMDGGKKVGYLKPPAGENGSDSDVVFMRQVLEDTDVVNAPDVIQGRDVVLVEAGLGTSATDPVSQDTYGAAREMKAKAIAVEAYSDLESCGESPYAAAYRGFGADLLGVVVNKVPSSWLKHVKERAGERFAAAGIRLLGVIPENRHLLAVTVDELAGRIQGKILNNEEKSGELVEEFLLGAMVVGSALPYFNRKKNKAAVIHQDRPDMQLAVLETPTRCLVLSGSQEPPVYNVQQIAETRGVPIVSTGAGTHDVIAGIEESLLNARLNQVQKLDRLAELVRQNLDLAAIV